MNFRLILTLGLAAAGFAVAQGHGDFTYMHAHMESPKVVKGAPYSAQAVRQFTQTLADGNHIQHSSTVLIARDSEGRSRREETIGSIGSLAASGATPKAVFIHDPVAGTSYVLDPAARTARQNTHIQSAGAEQDAVAHSPNAERANHAHARNSQATTEELGTQVMEGLTVTGKRITRTIPAGQAGNEKPLQSVTEIWYSQDLQAIVMSKTTDPRSGVSTYQLTSISRAEPDATLFQVPAGYSVTQGGGPMGGRRARQ
jgi:hypothetical protein